MTARLDQSSSTIGATARKLLAPISKELVQLLQELVSVNTVAVPPHGNETAGQRILIEFLKRHGVRSELYQTEMLHRTRNEWKRKDRDYTGRQNLIATLAGRGHGKSLLLNGHMDTVPPGRSQWKASPWSGNVSRGRMYGLGTIDMKGGLVAQAAVLCALRRAGIRLNGDLLFESVIDEEWGGCGGTLAARLRGYTADACVVAEGTQLEIYRATRGGLFADLTVDAGDPKKYFSQSEVLSPSIALGRLLGWVDSWLQRRKKVKNVGAYKEFADPAPVQVLAVEANNFDPNIPWSVPISAALRIYFQFLPHEDVKAEEKKIRLSLKKFCVGDPFFRQHPVKWKSLIDPALQGHEIALKHPWTQCMIHSAANTLGKEPVVTAAPFPCDASLLSREFGIPTLVFGPCGGGAHNKDEFVVIKSVLQTAEVFLAAALQWCA
jgi:acetylornithine deacetylase